MKKICSNKKAYYEYSILEKHLCGLVLKGSEVKSIKSSKVSIVEAYCFINNGEIFIKGMNVTPHKEGGIHNNHEPVRDRKLLMKKKEILKLEESMGQRGLTIIPLEILISKTGFIKMEIGLCRGKKLYDKRASIKDKDISRDLQRII